MHKAFHGDRASVRVNGVDRRGRPEGEIVEVLDRAQNEIVGRLHDERGVWFVVAENRRIAQDLIVPANDRGAAKPGDVVVVEIVQYPTGEREPSRESRKC
jgi:ribonuclease R